MTKCQQEFPDWYKKRNYLHFDYPPEFEYVESLVKDKDRLNNHDYWPFLKSELITRTYDTEENKVKKKPRPIMYASHIDAHIYSYFGKKLSDRYKKFIANTPIDNCAIAYRKIPRNKKGAGKSNIHFANEVFQYIAINGECTAVCYDVSSFFEALKHNVLKSNIEKILGLNQLPGFLYSLFKSLTKYSFVEKDNAIEVLKQRGVKQKNRLCSPDIFRNILKGNGLVEQNRKPYGIPQGSPLSALLSNIYMVEFDRIMSHKAKVLNGLYRRYSDDIIFVVDQKYQNEFEKILKAQLHSLGLTENDEKKKTTPFRFRNGNLESQKNPLQYLGFIFDGERVLLRSSSIARYYQKMKSSIYKVKKIADKNDKPFEYKKGLYERFTHLGDQNFITYAYFADQEMDNSEIRKQIKGHWDKFHKELEKDL